jgi:uncharacterized protein (DUF488 family)
MELSGTESGPGLFTVGHSNHPQDVFVGLLKRHEIQVLVDVRSYPYSRYVPHFNKEELSSALRAEGINYLYMGKELGGRPEEEEFYDEDGHVLYTRRAESPVFLGGIERLEKGIRQFRVAILCSEENPSVCHRHLLICRVMAQRGTKIRHIRGDGTIQFDADLPTPAKGQRSLFDLPGNSTWKSLLSVSRRKQPNNCLDFSDDVEPSDLSISD